MGKRKKLKKMILFLEVEIQEYSNLEKVYKFNNNYMLLCLDFKKINIVLNRYMKIIN